MVLSAFGPAPSGVFFTGVATAPSTLVPAQYPVAIGGHAYPIEPSLYSRSFLPLQRDARMDEAEPGEVAVSPSGMWRRSQSDWSLGAGQIWLDEVDSTRRRFNESLGIAVFTTSEDHHRICLLPAIEEKRNSANSNLRLLPVGARLYVVDGATLIFSNGSGSEQNATWVTGWTTATGLPGGNILDIAYSGSHVYVLGSDNSIYRATPGTTAFTLFYNPTAVAIRIFAGLGRLFMVGAAGRELYEVTATPGETLIFTHPDPNYVISHLCAAPTGIYFTGNIGTFGEVRHSWIRDDGTAFVAPVVAAEFINETVNTCISAGKTILVGTGTGFRFSDIDGATTGLDFGPVVPVGSVRQFVLDTDGPEVFAWFTWDSITPGNSGLGRIRLARFTEPRVPAYASDIFSAAGGSVLTVASLSGRRYFGVSTDGFFGATANLVAEGTLSTGRIRYGLLDEKVFSTVHIRTDPLEGGQITITVNFDDGATTVAGALSNPGAVQLGALGLGPRRGEWCEIVFTFERDGVDPTLGPCLRWWHLRSLPAPDSTQRFLVPLRLHAKEQTPNGPVRAIDVLNEIEFLAELVRNQSTVTYQEGLASYTVHLANIEVGGGRTGQWNRNDHRMEGITMVEMLTMD